MKNLQARISISKAGTPQIVLLAEGPAQKRTLTRLRNAFAAKKRMVVGNGIRGDDYLLFYLEGEPPCMCPPGKKKEAT